MLHAVPNGGAAVAQEAVPRQNQISWGLLTVRVASSDRKCARSSPATLATCCLLAAGRRETEEVALPAGAGDSKLVGASLRTARTQQFFADLILARDTRAVP